MKAVGVVAGGALLGAFFLMVTHDSPEPRSGLTYTAAELTLTPRASATRPPEGSATMPPGPPTRVRIGTPIPPDVVASRTPIPIPQVVLPPPAPTLTPIPGLPPVPPQPTQPSVLTNKPITSAYFPDERTTRVCEHDAIVLIEGGRVTRLSSASPGRIAPSIGEAVLEPPPFPLETGVYRDVQGQLHTGGKNCVNQRR